MKIIYFAIALLYLLLLSACGGGGGGSSSDAMSGGQPQDNDQMSTTGPSQSAGTQTAFSGSQTQGTNPAAQHTQSLSNVISQSSKTLFGSVVQSIDVGISDVTRIGTSFNGDRFTLQINREDGSSIVLDTDRDETDGIDVPPSDNLVTNRPGAEGYIVSTDNTSFTLSSVSIEWSNSDFGDYLAGGYWMHVETAPLGLEIGAFIDGPDYDSAVDVPVSGTATYNGRAGGMYISVYGTDLASFQLPVGSVEFGDYIGDMRLVANFSTRSIAGDIYAIELLGGIGVAPNGAVYETPESTSVSGYELELGAAPISQNGQFTGNSVRLTHPNANFTSAGGTWAGRFSTVDDSAGFPRAVAGTHMGYAVTSLGSEVSFVGAQYGATERFQ